MKFKVGEIPVLISGKNSIADALLEELSLFPKTEKSPYLEFLFLKDIHDMHKKHKNNYFYIEQENYNLQIIGKLNDSNKTEVNILLHYREPNFWLSKLRWNMTYRFNHWSYVFPYQSCAHNILDSAYQPMMHLKLLNFGGAFIHAGSIVKNGKVILFPAKPGVGKTNIVIRMVSYGGWQFFADDFTIIREDSMAYLNPRYIPVYPYQLKFYTELFNKFLETRSIIDKIQWQHRSKKYGSRGVRRRVSPIELFGKDKIGTQGKIDKVIFIEITDDRYCTLLKAEPRDIARWSAEITMKEIITPSLTHWNKLFNMKKIIEKCIDIYTQAISNKECYKLNIPRHAKFDKVCAFLKTELSL